MKIDTLFWVIAIAQGIILGVMTMILATKKGYGQGYFWLGFFLSAFGLIFVAGLPVSEEKMSHMIARLQSQPNETKPAHVPAPENLNSAKKIRCPSCDALQDRGRASCWECGAFLRERK